MKDSRVILCTGGVGSGKSYVVRAFRMLGIPAYDCDRAAKECYDRDPRLLSDVVSLAGPEVLAVDGTLDRAALSRRIFSDPALLAAVEALVHPAVIHDFENWKSGRPEPLLLIESAILLEKPQYARLYDRVVTVTAPVPVRIARVMARSDMTEAEVLRRMSAQWSDDRLAAASDYILENDDRQALLPAILDIIEKETKDGKD